MVRPSRMTGRPGPFLAQLLDLARGLLPTLRNRNVGGPSFIEPEPSALLRHDRLQIKSHHAQQILVLHLGQVDLVSAGQQIVRQALLRLDQRVDLPRLCPGRRICGPARCSSGRSGRRGRWPGSPPPGSTTGRSGRRETPRSASAPSPRLQGQDEERHGLVLLEGPARRFLTAVSPCRTTRFGRRSHQDTPPGAPSSRGTG